MIGYAKDAEWDDSFEPVASCRHCQGAPRLARRLDKAERHARGKDQVGNNICTACGTCWRHGATTRCPAAARARLEEAARPQFGGDAAAVARLAMVTLIGALTEEPKS